MESRAHEQTPVREAREEDAHEVADILAEAFAKDPVMNWMLGSARPIKLTFLEVAKGILSRKGFGHIVENSAATLWTPAGVTAKLPFLSELRLLFSVFASGGLAAMRRTNNADRLMADSHPPTAHFYLLAVGVRANVQGKGLGGQVIREGLKMADEVGLPVYLENSNPRNTLLYERLGFRKLAPLGLPDGAPPLLGMMRDARCAL